MHRTMFAVSIFSIAALGAGGALILSGDAQGQAAPAAPARYNMDVGTSTGFGLGAFGGGGRPSLGALLGRGGNEPRKEVFLRLGSPLAATGGAPHADHFMPQGARLGASVPLVTPVQTPTEETDRVPGQRDGERPSGRILIFWGCGAHAPAGQPVIIDLARITAGQVPRGLFSTTIPREREVSFTNSRTYGDWPNSQSRASVSSQSSVVGAHRIAGNYSPEIAFSLTQDFMAGLNPTSADQPDGSLLLNWAAVPAATGYYAWTMGFNGDGPGRGGDMVWWSSSSSQQFGGGLWDWLSPATVQRLVQQRVVMSPTTTSCQVPMEVKRAAPGIMFGNLYAYGPEANFAFPPRPANARTPWRPIWTARVRYRSNAGWMIGGPNGDSASNNSGNNEQRCRRRGGIAGAIARAAGAGGCQ